MVDISRPFRDTILTFLRRKSPVLLVFGGVCLVGGAYLLLTPAALHVRRLAGAAVRSAHGAGHRPHAQPDAAAGLQRASRNPLFRRRHPAQPGPAPPRHQRRSGWRGSIRRSPRRPRSGARRLDEALKALRGDLVVDVGLQSDVINLSLSQSGSRRWHATPCSDLLDQFYAQEAAVYANPQLKFAEDEANAASATS